MVALALSRFAGSASAPPFPEMLRPFGLAHRRDAQDPANDATSRLAGAATGGPGAARAPAETRSGRPDGAPQRPNGSRQPSHGLRRKAHFASATPVHALGC